jgi:hypothetical protein
MPLPHWKNQTLVTAGSGPHDRPNQAGACARAHAGWEHGKSTLARYSGSSHLRRMEAEMASRCACDPYFVAGLGCRCCRGSATKEDIHCVSIPLQSPPTMCRLR